MRAVQLQDRLGVAARVTNPLVGAWTRAVGEKLPIAWESGPKRQTELAEELGMEAYAVSRLLAKLKLVKT